MQAVADRINKALREQYGLARDIVYVDGYRRLALIDNADIGSMGLFAMTIEHLCSKWAAPVGEPTQLRMF